MRVAALNTAPPQRSLGLLGSFRLDAVGDALPAMLPRKTKALLALLALAADDGATRDRVAAWLWPDSAAALARQSLRQALSDVRRVDAGLIRDEGERLYLDDSVCAVDVLQLRRWAEAEDVACLQAAVALYRGPLLDGLEVDSEAFADWLAAERAALAALARSTAARLAARHEAASNWHEAVAVYERMLAMDMADEGAWQGLMRVRLRAGEPALALGAYARCRDSLQRALAVFPGPLTRSLAEQARLAMLPEPAPARAPAARAGTVPALVVLDFDADTPALAPRALALSRRLAGELARRPGLAVMAGRYALAGVAAQDEAQQRALLERGVDWVLWGTLECGGTAQAAARLALQIACVRSGRLHWSRSWPWPVEGSDGEALAALAAALEAPLALLPSTDTPEAAGPWAHWRAAQAALFARGWSEASVRTAVEAYRSALRADPALALAHAHLSLVLSIAGKMGLVHDADAPAAARAAAERAIELAPFDSEVLGYAGCAIADLGDPIRGEPLLERAVEENPANPQAWSALGACRLSLQRTADGVALLERGLRVGPADYRRTVWLTLRSRGLLSLGQCDEALAAAREAVRTDFHFYPAYLALAAVHARLEHPGEATHSLAAALRIRPRLEPAEARPWVGPRMMLRLQSLWPAGPPVAR